MTLFFLILLAVSLSIFGFQRLRRRQKKPTIKPSLPKVEELQQMETQIPEKPAATASQIPQSVSEPVIVEPKKPVPQPVSQPANPVSPELGKPIPSPEPGPRPALPLEEEPILLSPKEPEPPGNLPTG